MGAPAIVVAILIALGGLFGAHQLDKGHAVAGAFKAGQAEVQGRWAIERAIALAEALKASQARQAEDTRRVSAQRELDNENQRLVASRAAAARDAADAVGRLRVAGAGFTARTAGPGLSFNPTAAGERAALATLRDLLEDSAERHRRLGLEADDAAGAADDCAARYGSLKAAP